MIARIASSSAASVSARLTVSEARTGAPERDDAPLPVTTGPLP